ncbi:MAG: acyl-CoA dehydrogenase family protein [Pseudomonadota bacterium]
MNNATLPVNEQARLAGADLLRQLRAQFDTALRALARRCAPAGKLDAQCLDAVQPASYELAWASAELLAADGVLQAAPASALDLELALAFCADAIVSVLQRLDGVFLDLRLDRGVLLALGGGDALGAFRHDVGSAAVLATIGRQVAARGGEIGDVALDDDVAMAQQAFRRFAEEQVAPRAEQIHRQDLTVPETLLQPLREMGVFGLSVPERFGGSAPDGGDNTPMMIAVTEALSQASLAAAGSLITRPEILARALMAGGTPQQQQYWLPRIARGEPLCAIAITEPDFGSDVASLALKARRVAGGWRLDGAKTWCTFAGKAGLLMVVARTGAGGDGHRGLSLMLVTKPSDEGHAFRHEQPGGGSLSGHAIATIGYRGMHSFDLAFDDYFVADEEVIGMEQGLGQGFYYTMAGMVGGRIQTAARACGVMRAALAAACRYTGERRVFGAELGEFALTQVKLARMAARVHACRQLTYAVGHRLDAGGERTEASLVKLLACRSAELVTREAMQLHGGIGYAEEMPVSRYFLDARVLSIFEGAEETLALKVIARSLLETALENSHA